MNVCGICEFWVKGKAQMCRAVLFCLDLMCDLYVLSRQKLYVVMIVYISWLPSIMIMKGM